MLVLTKIIIDGEEFPETSGNFKGFTSLNSKISFHIFDIEADSIVIKQNYELTLDYLTSVFGFSYNEDFGNFYAFSTSEYGIKLMTLVQSDLSLYSNKLRTIGLDNYFCKEVHKSGYVDNIPSAFTCIVSRSVYDILLSCIIQFKTYGCDVIDIYNQTDNTTQGDEIWLYVLERGSAVSSSHIVFKILDMFKFEAFISKHILLND